MLRDRFDVRAVFNPVARLAENIAADFQADVVDGYRAMASRWDIDAILILQRTWLGSLPMMAAAEAGKAVYWAGPCDLHPVKDAEMRRVVEESGVSVMVEFPRRYFPATLRLKELMATRLGRPRLIFCHRRSGAQSGDEEAMANFQRAELTELVDWCRYVVGRNPTTVGSVAPRNSAGVCDYRTLSLDFQGDHENNQVAAQISVGQYVPAEWPEAIAYQAPSAMQIRCEHGIAFIDLPSTLVWFDGAGRHMESLETETPVGQQLLSQFYRCVTHLLRTVSDLDDAFAAAHVLAVAAESEKEGRRMAIAQTIAPTSTKHHPQP
jgi:predicted dehydrogenase